MTHWTCPYHHVELGDEPCPLCEEEYKKLSEPDKMTPDEREVEIKRWLGPLTISLDKVYERISALIGRKVLTSEIADRDKLIYEARNRRVKSDEETLEIMLEDLPVNTLVTILPEEPFILADNLQERLIELGFRKMEEDISFFQWKNCKFTPFWVKKGNWVKLEEEHKDKLIFCIFDEWACKINYRIVACRTEE